MRRWRCNRGCPAPRCNPGRFRQYTAPVIILDSITHHYGLRPVLRNLSMRIAPGELVAIMGPNGSGKSTLLKIIAGIAWPLRGTVTIDGKRRYVLRGVSWPSSLPGQPTPVSLPHAACRRELRPQFQFDRAASRLPQTGRVQRRVPQRPDLVPEPAGLAVVQQHAVPDAARLADVEHHVPIAGAVVEHGVNACGLFEHRRVRIGAFELVPANIDHEEPFCGGLCPLNSVRDKVTGAPSTDCRKKIFQSEGAPGGDSRTVGWERRWTVETANA
jgi:energy-coupling factor transporter ATP-binding protein EcfA2